MNITLGDADVDVGGYYDTVKQEVELYKAGKMVVVFSTTRDILVGREDVERIAATHKNEEATCIFGIDHTAWDATDCPELCAAARQAYYLPQQSPQSVTVKVEMGSGNSRITREMFDAWTPTKDDILN